MRTSGTILFVLLLFSSLGSNSNLISNNLYHYLHSELFSKNHEDSVKIVNYAQKMALDWIKKYEGGYQAMPEDPGNYSPDGRILGTKHGISASFICRYKPKLCNDSAIKAINEEEAAEIIVEYIVNSRPIRNMDSLFISIYVLYAMYYGIELADFYVCRYYGVNPSAYNAIAIYNQPFVTKELCLYLLNVMEYLIHNFSCPNNPIFCTGWKNRFYETKKQLLSINSSMKI